MDSDDVLLPGDMLVASGPVTGGVWFVLERPAGPEKFAMGCTATDWPGGVGYGTMALWGEHWERL